MGVHTERKEVEKTFGSALLKKFHFIMFTPKKLCILLIVRFR